MTTMNKFVLLIAGTRTYNDYTHFKAIVDFVLPKNCEIEIVHGGAKGADSLANTYANDNGYKCTIFNADWSVGKSAGYIRNKQMHDYIKQFEHRGCLCFWDGKSKGTRHNFKLANDNRTRLKIYNYIEHKFVKTMIYTSYFAKLNKLPSNIIPISICGKAPDWYKGLQYKKLAPKYDFFMEWKQNHDNDYYIKCFNKQVLGELNISEVIDNLGYLTSYDQSKDICLMCYEKPSDFCHRHLVANWLNENGIPCEEYKFD